MSFKIVNHLIDEWELKAQAQERTELEFIQLDQVNIKYV